MGTSVGAAAPADRSPPGVASWLRNPDRGVDLDPFAAAQFKHTPTYMHINRKTDGTTTYDR
ncbi:hypothetical protein [Promicromonospora umidemergens]|nr:hypothetical protein [Promicromonospora umidemergens]